MNDSGHTLTRRELPIPREWKVTRGGRVQVLDSATLEPRELPVRGTWTVIDRAPAGWWLQPADDLARWWMRQHGTNAGATSGCIGVHGQRLVPSFLDLGRR